MGEFQACTPGLEASCTSRLISQPMLTLSHKNQLSPVPSVSTNEVASGEGDESRGTLLTGKRPGGKSPRPLPLKRSRGDDDEFSIPHMEISPPNEEGGLYVNHQHYQNIHSAVKATRKNLPSVSPSQQPVIHESNGHATIPAAFELKQFGSDQHFLPGTAHQGALLYPQVSGPGSYVGVSVNVAEVLAELERTKRRNIELQGIVSSLEAKLSKDEKHGCTISNGSKKSKKLRKADKCHGEGDEEDGRKAVRSSQSPLAPVKQEEPLLPQDRAVTESTALQDRQDNVVNWMSREEVTPADLEKLNSMGSERDDSGDSDDDDEDDEDDDDVDEEDQEGREDGSEIKGRKVEGSESWKPGEERKGVVEREVKGEAGGGLTPINQKLQGEDDSGNDGKKHRRKKRKIGNKGRRGQKTVPGKRGLGHELSPFRAPGIMASYKKAPKTAFCPKEVKRIMESGVLTLKNAQSHTMRKIIVFASLGIRHGCEDLCELDFNHFSIQQRGEPFTSPKEPGEHVLYDHPGVRTKMFYPNRQNPILCPVKILDEERAMRPAGPSCPSCLFLCIKYGGRTRNLPQNEYVRQRMGRNKLKSFGPLMCQMALLVHIRTGSFFFKALGITLLFMAGFPDDLVRKETKYRNLDLLQKYYRSDEDAKQDGLFHPYPPFFVQATMAGTSVQQKTTVVGSKVVGKKGPPPLLSKPPVPHTGPRYLQPVPTRAPANPPFGGPPLAFPPALPPVPAVPPTSGTPGTPSPPCSHPPPFAMYPGYPPLQRTPGGFAPLPGWPPVNTYPPPPGAYAHQHQPAYAYPPYPPQYASQPFYGPPYGYPPFGGQPVRRKNEVKKEAEGTESDSDSDSSSNGGGQKSEDKCNSSDSKDQKI